MNKCRRCVWSDKIDSNRVFCVLPKCIRKLESKKVNEGEAVSYYNIWRKHYLESSRDDLKLSGIFIKQGRNRKRLEECSYKERQKYLQALNKDQLIKITQVVLK